MISTNPVGVLQTKNGRFRLLFRTLTLLHKTTNSVCKCSLTRLNYFDSFLEEYDQMLQLLHFLHRQHTWQQDSFQHGYRNKTSTYISPIIAQDTFLDTTPIDRKVYTINSRRNSREKRASFNEVNCARKSNKAKRLTTDSFLSRLQLSHYLIIQGAQETGPGIVA